MASPKRRDETLDPLALETPTPDPVPKAPVDQDPPAEPDPIPDVTADPAVRMAIARAAKKARADAIAEVEAAAKVTAERSKLDELERTKVELAEARAASASAKAASEAAAQDRDLTDAILTGGHRLAGGQSLKFVRAAVAEALGRDSTLDVESALVQVLRENSFLLRADDAGQQAPAVRPASTAPASKVPAAPAVRDPSPPVDVLSMTPAEYTAYRQKTHGA